MVKLAAERAPAKINLYLRVTGRRADGYHELDSIFLPVGISDLVRIEIRTAAEPMVTLRCDVPALAAVKANLASRAAAEFMKEYGVVAQVSIELAKRIPVGAGLGGGSSDAGAVLRMMAALCGAPDDDRLARVAVALGADVPFFLDPRPSRVRGIGERCEVLPPMAPLPVVIAIPPVEVPTAQIFRALSREDWSGAAAESDIREIVAGRITPSVTVNDLAAPAMRLYPAIGRLKAALEEEGAQASAMSGSGGSVFGVFSDAAAAHRAAGSIRSRAPEATVIATSTTGGETAFESGRQ
jgi:4-diphosphocytidyl-2-C-methyl-D-erythritol kinase